jgi:Ser/Thr protein kinase RdoA (MazF antagonist)
MPDVAPDTSREDLGPVLAAFGVASAAYRPLGAGLINQTWRVEGGSGGRLVLQRLHPIFPAEVNDDIDAVTRHLEACGLVTPRLVPTVTGARWFRHAGAVWRALTWVDGVGLDRLGHPAQAREAGAALARFHHAVSSLEHEFRNTRPGVHETARHLAALGAALEAHRDHPRHAQVEPLARRVLAAAAELPPLAPVAPRIVHGDPKVNNILFTPDGTRALCLIDLDTLGRMALPLELGDAFRSWCNPAGEDSARASFALELFEAGVGGYAAAAGGLVTAEEWRSIVAATLTIYVELAARFCADALNESYFGWDPTAFATRGEHNQVRAESQLAAARSLAGQRVAAERIVARAFGG